MKLFLYKLNSFDFLWFGIKNRFIKLRIDNLCTPELSTLHWILLTINRLIITGIHWSIKLMVIWHHRIIKLRMREIKGLRSIFVIFRGFLGFRFRRFGFWGIRLFIRFSSFTIYGILPKSWVQFEKIFGVYWLIIFVYFLRIRIFSLFFLHIC